MGGGGCSVIPGPSIESCSIKLQNPFFEFPHLHNFLKMHQDTLMLVMPMGGGGGLIQWCHSQSSDIGHISGIFTSCSDLNKSQYLCISRCFLNKAFRWQCFPRTRACVSYQIDTWWSLQTRLPPARRSSPRGAHPLPSSHSLPAR